jgi:hypothetical protein
VLFLLESASTKAHILSSSNVLGKTLRFSMVAYLLTTHLFSSLNKLAPVCLAPRKIMGLLYCYELVYKFQKSELGGCLCSPNIYAKVNENR